MINLRHGPILHAIGKPNDMLPYTYLVFDHIKTKVTSLDRSKEANIMLDSLLKRIWKLVFDPSRLPLRIMLLRYKLAFFILGFSIAKALTVKSISCRRPFFLILFIFYTPF